jgi:imidazolonepropionase-like amidohydrolase
MRIKITKHFMIIRYLPPVYFLCITNAVNFFTPAMKGAKLTKFRENPSFCNSTQDFSRHRRNISIITRQLFAAILIFAASTMAFGQGESTLITGVTVHTATGETIENGAVGIDSSLINFVGKAKIAPDGYDRTVTRDGMHLYPGLIAPNTTLGLTEIFAVRATRDYDEVGKMNPNVRAISAYNAESYITETVLANGVLFAQICPRGGVIKGTSSVVKLKGWNWEDAAYHIDEGIHMDWPRPFKRKGERDDPREYTWDEGYQKQLDKIETFFRKSDAYAQRKAPLERDLRMEAMRGIFDGAQRLYISANFIKEIREVIAFKREFSIEKVTIIGGYDAWMAADLLAENEISVMVRRPNNLPRFAEDPVDANFSLPAKLADAGVEFCLQMDGRMEAIAHRNLPFNAGSAIAYGLSREEALKAITLYPAEILGIANRTGSIEIGKEANFIITEGDLFDMRTGKIESVYLQGEQLDITTRQEELYKKYAKKYGLDVE